MKLWIFWKMSVVALNSRKIWVIVIKLHKNIIYRSRTFRIEFHQTGLKRSNFLRFLIFWKFGIDWGKLSQWLFRQNYLLERIIGHILDVSVNAKSFPVQCSVIASAALTKDRVLHFLPRKKKFIRSIFT